MALPKGAKVFNVVRENASQVFMQTVPSATEDNIDDRKEEIKIEHVIDEKGELI